ncbi:hypothetical protein I4U23_010491 [Adineta vaga]|nr:hypothetical protein I4U23_010491 [Adineta vaga]
MASNQEPRDYYGPNRRPRSNYNTNNSYGRGRNSNRGSFQSHPHHYESDSRSEEYMSDQQNHRRQRQFDNSSTVELKPIDDEKKAYAVNLQLDPVEMGIIARNNRWHQEFKGLGAFNRYFGLLSSEHGFGYTLPDIWDGYFHITLAKFTTKISAEKFKDKFQQFRYPIETIPYIPDVVFHTSTIERIPGPNRGRGRENIDFIVLPIDITPEVRSFYERIQLLLDAIKELAGNPEDWITTELKKLHVTIRKYSNIDYNLYPLNNIRIQEFPLEFRCSYVGVREPRDTTINRIMQNEDLFREWLSGVTEIRRHCSGCQTLITTRDWQGFCFACGNYEIINPLWSTTGTNSNLQPIPNDTLSLLVEDLSLNGN